MRRRATSTRECPSRPPSPCLTPPLSWVLCLGAGEGSPLPRPTHPQPLPQHPLTPITLGPQKAHCMGITPSTAMRSRTPRPITTTTTTTRPPPAAHPPVPPWPTQRAPPIWGPCTQPPASAHSSSWSCRALSASPWAAPCPTAPHQQQGQAQRHQHSCVDSLGSRLPHTRHTKAYQAPASDQPKAPLFPLPLPS